MMVGIVLMHRSSPLFRLTLKHFPFFHYIPGNVKTVYSKTGEKKLEECYKILKVPNDSKQDIIREAYLSLAKRYHPDSGSADANVEKFVALQNAFRTLCKHHGIKKDLKDVVRPLSFDIKHTAPQHRQYLDFEGIGHGTPFQRQKQWTNARAQKAADNVMNHRVAKAMAVENTLMSKGEAYRKKHDIKTNQGFDRLVEDLILESMSKGEFNNLKGKGKPLKEQNRNPYVDFITHKLNEVLINNGFTPGWITMSKEINQNLQLLKRNLEKERKYLGPYPLNVIDTVKWEKICEENRHSAKDLNKKINEYNLIVPLMNKQKFYVQYNKICEEILKNGTHSVERAFFETKSLEHNIVVDSYTSASHNSEDIFATFFRAIGELFTFNKKK